MSFSTLLLYIATWTMVAVTPGPAVMCAMTHATRFGWRTSLIGIAGIQTGNLLFFLCVAGGLAALLSTATIFFEVLRIVGAAYLLYLGVRVIVGTFRWFRPQHAEATTPARKRGRGVFVQGLLVQLTNPKALLFVSALLPQFIDATRPALAQLAILVVVTIAIDTAVLGGYAYFTERGARSFRTTRFATWLERALGAAFVFFGLRLLLARR